MGHEHEESSIGLLASGDRQSYEEDSRASNELSLSPSGSSASTLYTELDADLEQQQKTEDGTLTRLPDLQNPQPSSLKSRPSTTFLDGLRGLAALFVFLQHANPCNEDISKRGFGQDGSWQWTSLPFVRMLFTGGDAAVPVFFVLSGYVLSRGPLCLNRDGQQKSTMLRRLASSVVRRPFRLYIPPLVISFLVALMMQLGVNAAMFLPPSDSIEGELRRWFDLSVQMFNPFQFQPEWYSWYIYDIAVWTLPLELKGSMLIYGLAACDAAFSLAPWISLSLLSLLTVALMQTSIWTMGCFVAGMALAYVEVHEMDEIASTLTSRVRSITNNIVFVTGFYLLSEPNSSGHPQYALDTPGWFYLTQSEPLSYDDNQYGRYWTSWGALLVVSSSFRLRYLRTFLSSHVLLYLGKISFMLYLVHTPILGGMRDIYRLFGSVQPGSEAWEWDNWIPIPDIGPDAMTLRYLVVLAVETPICFVVADVLTRFLDKPSVYLGSWITRKIRLDTKSS